MEIKWALDWFDPEEDAAFRYEVLMANVFVNTYFFAKGFVDERANVVYYSANMREKLLDKMVELGYREKHYDVFN